MPFWFGCKGMKRTADADAADFIILRYEKTLQSLKLQGSLLAEKPGFEPGLALTPLLP